MNNSSPKIVSKKKASGSLLETAKTVLYAVLIALVVRTVAYEPFNIPSGSMIPTLLIGDYLFVSKFSFGYSRYSLPFGLPLFTGRIYLPFSDMPQRGDVAVFKLPTDPSVDYIKRIVGLPGDRVQVRHGELYVNDQLVPRRPNPACRDDEAGIPVAIQQGYIESLPRRPGETPLEHCIIKVGDNGPLDNTPVYEVPPGYYFAMGDNRDNSQDSRVLSAVGYIPADNLVGKAQFLFFSTDGSARWWEIWKWPFAIRYRRLFNGVS
ncbi:MAG TPA: signal peptidase I [Stellaceae bacterium]|jgi:signal peptidase I|nr:signal peptidase I [Stellaceae bacterium]